MPRRRKILPKIYAILYVKQACQLFQNNWQTSEQILELMPSDNHRRKKSTQHCHCGNDCIVSLCGLTQGPIPHNCTEPLITSIYYMFLVSFLCLVYVLLQWFPNLTIFDLNLCFQFPFSQCFTITQGHFNVQDKQSSVRGKQVSFTQYQHVQLEQKI